MNRCLYCWKPLEDPPPVTLPGQLLYCSEEHARKDAPPQLEPGTNRVAVPDGQGTLEEDA